MNYLSQVFINNTNNGSQEGVYIRVNDIFDELSEENKRLNEELVFANNCLNVLNKFKSFLSKIYLKFESIIDSEDKQEFSRLQEEFESVIKSKKVFQNNSHKSVESPEECLQETNQESVQKSKSEFKVIESQSKSTTNRDQKTQRFLGKEDSKSETKTSRLSKRTINLNLRRNETNVKNGQSVGGTTDEPKPKKRSNLVLNYSEYFDENTQRYVCKEDNCSSSFKSRKYFWKHIYEFHRLENNYICNHKDCNKSYRSAFQLKCHSYVHRRVRSFVCPVAGCSLSFKQRSRLLHHLKGHSEQLFVMKVHNRQQLVVNKHSNTQLSSHLDIQSERSEDKRKEWQTTVQKIVSNDKQNESQTKPLRKRLLYSNNFDANTQRYVCFDPNCHKTFDTKHKSTNHFRSVHFSLRSFSCDYPNCGKSFKTKANYERHVTHIHTEERPFVCTVNGCEYKGKTKVLLEFHLATHSNDRPKHKCSQCLAEFRSKFSLKDHMKSIHSREPAFKCNFEGCDQRFRTRDQLLKHKKLDHLKVSLNRHKCDWPGCEYETPNRTKFKEHMCLHTGEKLHPCPWQGCGKQFRTQSRKNIHLLVHKNEKKYACDWPGCEYRGNVPTQIRQHKIWNHK